ncbi:MAG: type II/IV secretion system ATPase subunit [Thermoplasmata archaeon]|nr:type II/IV secretion system ATPase subunit [Thermoplasmata archaeon]
MAPPDGASSTGARPPGRTDPRQKPPRNAAESKPQRALAKVSPNARAALLQRSLALDAKFVNPSLLPEKVAVQSELGEMRRQLLGDRREVNLTYPVNPPYAFVHIAFSENDGEFQYTVLEPTLHVEEKAKIVEIRKRMEAIMGQEELPFAGTQSIENSPILREYLRQRFLTVLDLYDIEVPLKRRPVLLYYLHREFLGLGRTDAILRDPFLEDVSCLGPGVPLFVFHRVFGSVRTNIVFDNELELNKYVFRLAQLASKHISIYQPILDATLRDGSRINLTLGTEVTRKGSTFSIRKFSQDPVSPIDLLRFGSLSATELAYFWMLIEHHRSLLISGGTASGKTTLLNAISMFIRPEDKIVSIEDTPEIHIDHQNWIQSVARSGYGMASGISGASGVSGISGNAGRSVGSVTLFDLLVAALRQRPEYVIVGEVRGSESFTLFQAISVGHASMSTIHAGSIGELLHRVENEPMNIPRVLFQALDSVAFPAQVSVKNNRVRRVSSITEILEVDPETNELLTNEVFRWDPVEDRFTFLGRSFVLEKIGKVRGKSLDWLFGELRRKESYLEMMNRANITYFKDVSRAIAAYYVDPSEAVRKLQGLVAS